MTSLNISFRSVSKLIAGLSLYALGIVVFAQSNIGMAPWDVLSDGISQVLGISLGTAVIGISITLIITNYIFGMKIGLANIVDFLMVGPFVDLIISTDIIPLAQNLLTEYLMVFCGLMILNTATYFFVGAGLGAGPRDGLMIVLVRKTRFSIRVVKSSMELLAIGAGILLGGRFGIGTVIVAVLGGPMMNLFFDIIHFDIKSVQQVYLDYQFSIIRERIKDKRTDKEKKS